MRSTVALLHRWLGRGVWVAALTCTQCFGPEAKPKLPPETVTGANTVGCKVNGAVLVPRNRWTNQGLSLRIDVRGEAEPSRFGFAIIDFKAEGNPMVIIDVDSVVLRTGQAYPFVLGQRQTGVRARYSAAQDYVADAGELTITRLDRAEKVLAGRFQFTATDSLTGQQVRVTEGRFDFQLY